MTANPLDRFHAAQDASHAGFASALAELRTTGKRGHWIWYVFPQLAGLGLSSQARTYGIRDVDEAVAYLRDPVLRSRLIAVTRAAAQRLQEGLSLTALMGSHVDSLKLVSSLTLFERVARRLAAEDRLPEHAELADAARRVLSAAERQGVPPCARTLRELGAERPGPGPDAPPGG